jgi:hypothetical protein
MRHIFLQELNRKTKEGGEYVDAAVGIVEIWGEYVQL